MTDFSRLLEQSYFGNTVHDWGVALLAFLVTFTVLPIIKGYIDALRKRRTALHNLHTLRLAGLLVERTSRLFLWIVALWIGERLLVLPKQASGIFDAAVVVVLWLQVGIWGQTAVRYFIDLKRDGAPDQRAAGSFAILTFIGQLLVWALVVLLALDNLNIKVTPLLASLGIGGIAMALAVQSVLSDLLASLSITLDKPFVIGDFLVLDQDNKGKVEKIGIKSTLLRSPDGEQIIVSNADLLKSRVHNFGRLYERRVAFLIRVPYETTRAKLKEIPAILKQAVLDQQKTRFDRSNFKEYGDSALLFEAVYFVLDADANLAMDIQQAINFQLHERFERFGIEFAFPRPTVLLRQEGDAKQSVTRQPET